MKKILSLTLALSLFLGLNSLALAKNNKNFAPEMEEAVDGIYDVAGRPDLKVKVFVHKEKAKPDGVSSAQVCSSDPNSTSVVGSTGWHLPSNISYRLNPSSVPNSVGGGNLANIVFFSFSSWQNALASSSPNITRGLDTSVNRSRLDGQNVIAWGRTSGSTLGVTYTWYYTATGEVAEVDTIMNTRVAWKWNGGSATCAESTAYDAQNIMIHELGHWYGLDDEYDASYVDNTMYGYGSKGEVKKDTLTSGDIAGVNSIY